MSNLALLYDAPFGNRTAWDAFALAHFMHHKTLRSFINAPITASKVDNAEPDRLDWMQSHATEHMALAVALNVQASTYVAEADLTNKDQYANWMYYHNLEHRLFDQALGL